MINKHLKESCVIFNNKNPQHTKTLKIYSIFWPMVKFEPKLQTIYISKNILDYGIIIIKSTLKLITTIEY